MAHGDIAVFFRGCEKMPRLSSFRPKVMAHKHASQWHTKARISKNLGHSILH